jgi:hypothetical protein
MRAGASIWRASTSASRAQRDRPGRVSDKQVSDRGDTELEGGGGEVAAGPRYGGGLFVEAGVVGERAGSKREI